MPQKIIAWVSRHPPLRAQINELHKKLGDIKLMQVTNTYQNYRDVLHIIKSYNATHAILVLPLSMIVLILDSKEVQGITWLRAEMDSAHTGKCIDSYKEIANDRHNSVVQLQHQCSRFDPDADVVTGERHLRFREFQVLKSIDIVTEPFIETKKQNNSSMEEI